MAKYNSPYLQAAFELAQEAHAGQMRRDGSGYIKHPVMVADILQKFGCSELQQAVALLHDTLEDWKPLDNSSLNLHIQLMRKLEKKIQPSSVAEYKELESWSHAVCNGVKALTNDTYRYEGKRTYQASKAKELSVFLGPIKTIDQAASVIDDIMGCDFTNEKSVNKSRGFALKGFDVARSASDMGTPFRRFYAKLYMQFKQLLVLSRESPPDIEAIDTLRQGFDYTAMIEQAKEEVHIPLVPGLMPANVESYYNPLFVDNPTGIERITVSEAGKVVSYGMVVSSDEAEQNPANRLSIQLRDELEKVSGLFINTGYASRKPVKLTPFGLEEHQIKEDNRIVYVRDFAIEPPMDLALFMQHAGKTEALHKESPLFREMERVLSALSTQKPSRAL